MIPENGRVYMILELPFTHDYQPSTCHLAGIETLPSPSIISMAWFSVVLV